MVGTLLLGGSLVGSQACGTAFEAGPQGGGGAGAGTATTSTGTATVGGGGGSAGSSTSNGATGGVAGAGGGPGGENCYNNQDDDGDNRVDCADDECASQGFTCRALGSWQAPVILLGADSEDQCPYGWELDTNWTAGAAIEPPEYWCSCNACNLSDVECNAVPGVDLFSQSGCGGPSALAEGTTLGVCFTLTTATSDTLSIRAKPIAPTGDCSIVSEPTGNCELTGPQQRCTRSSAGTGGCNNGAVCVPPPAPGLPVCVSRVGTHDCPAELATSDQRVIYELNDTRQCECLCEPYCSVSATLYCDANCSPGDEVTATGAQCTNAPNCGTSRSARETATPMCEQSKTQTGSCTDEGHRLTFCCWTG